jgi:signal transduction histidine kinase
VNATLSRFTRLGLLSPGYRDVVSRVALTWALVVTVLIVPIVWLRQWSTGSPQYASEIAVRLTVVAAIFLVRNRVSANTRSALAAGLFLMVGTGSLLRAGPTAYAPFYLTMGVTVLGLCFGMRAWAWGCLGVVLGMAAIGAAITLEWIQPSYAVPEFLRTPMEFGVVALLVVLMSLLLLQVVIALLDQLNEKTFQLGERVKELTALHAASRRLETSGPIDGPLLQDLVALLPPAWQYPAICEGRIACGAIEAATPRFRLTPWMQSEEFVIGEGTVGRIEVAYLEERPAAAEGPFLAEERSLIQSLADVLKAHFEQRRSEAILREAHVRHERQESALNALSRHYVEQYADVDAMLRDVTRVVADTLLVDRTSVWRFARGQTTLTCRQSFDRRGDGVQAATELSRDRHLAYFEALEGSDAIDAHDARTDPRTQPLADEYLIPLGISSLLDVPIGGHGRAQGALCCEHVGGLRRWTADEQTFLVAVSNLVSALVAQIDRQAMERQLQQAQKMEAIGTLAGGIAHDFNNILSAINGYTELARMDIGDDAAVLEHLDVVAQGGARAARLVRQILTFSRQQEHERMPTEIGLVVGEALTLLKATLPASIEIVTAIAPDLPTVLADPTQVHQVVMNLCTNAWHAMQDQPGCLEIHLDRLLADADFIEAHPVLTAGAYARLSISDTGHGMDTDTMARIFEPFFTTKGPQSGTGLGLSVVHGIMQAHGGAITVYSHPGEGTTFNLYFPAHETDEHATPHVTEELPRGDGRHVLFVDDEAPLAQKGRKMLERLGYVVTAATSADDALVAFSSNPHAFDLLITDLTMPGRSGIDLAAEMLALRPDLRVVLVTGYTTTLTADRGRRLGIRELALKPLTLQRLATVVHLALA